MYIYLYTHTSTKCLHIYSYQIIFLFCKRALQKRLYSAKETYNFTMYIYLYTHTSTKCLHTYSYLIPCMRATTKLLASGMSAKFLYMGWLRLVGSLKLFVSFAKEPYKRDYTLQKRPIILRSLLIVATP